MTDTRPDNRRDVVAETMERITNTRGHVRPHEAPELEALVSAFWRDELYGELELRVGRRMVEGLSEVQLAEFDAISCDDADASLRWIESFVPNYRLIVAEETQALVVEAANAFAQVDPSSEWGADAHA